MHRSTRSTATFKRNRKKKVKQKNWRLRKLFDAMQRAHGHCTCGRAHTKQTEKNDLYFNFIDLPRRKYSRNYLCDDIAFHYYEQSDVLMINDEQHFRRNWPIGWFQHVWKTAIRSVRGIFVRHIQFWWVFLRWLSISNRPIK